MGVEISGTLTQIGNGVYKLAHAGDIKYTLGLNLDELKEPGDSLSQALDRVEDKHKSTTSFMVIYEQRPYSYQGGTWADVANWQALPYKSTTDIQGNPQGTANNSTNPGIPNNGDWWLVGEDYTTGGYSNFNFALGEDPVTIRQNHWLWYNGALSKFVILKFEVDEAVLTPLVGKMKDLDLNTSTPYNEEGNPLNSSDYPSDAGEDGNNGAVKRAIQSIQNWGKTINKMVKNLNGKPRLDEGNALAVGDLDAANVQYRNLLKWGGKYSWSDVNTFINNLKFKHYNTGYNPIDSRTNGRPVEPPEDVIEWIGRRLNLIETGAGGQPKILPYIPVTSSKGYYLIRYNNTTVSTGELNPNLVNRNLYDNTLTSRGYSKNYAVVRTDGDGKIPNEVIPTQGDQVGANVWITSYNGITDNSVANLSEFIDKRQTYWSGFKEGDLVLIQEGYDSRSGDNKRILYAHDGGSLDNISNYQLVTSREDNWITENPEVLDLPYTGTLNIDCKNKIESTFNFVAKVANATYYLDYNPTADDGTFNIINPPKNGLVILRFSSEYYLTNINFNIINGPVFIHEDSKHFDGNYTFNFDLSEGIKVAYIILRYSTYKESGTVKTIVEIIDDGVYNKLSV